MTSLSTLPLSETARGASASPGATIAGVEVPEEIGVKLLPVTLPVNVPFGPRPFLTMLLGGHLSAAAPVQPEFFEIEDILRLSTATAGNSQRELLMVVLVTLLLAPRGRCFRVFNGVSLSWLVVTNEELCPILSRGIGTGGQNFAKILLFFVKN